MKVKIYCVGKLKKEFKVVFDEYFKRVSKFVEVCEFKNTKKLKEKLDQIDKKNIFICHDAGKEYTSEEFANLLKKNKEIIFVIGGPEGFDFNIDRYNKISFSKMVYTHQLFRIMLIEQIYRAYAINNNLSFPK